MCAEFFKYLLKQVSGIFGVKQFLETLRGNNFAGVVVYSDYTESVVPCRYQLNFQDKHPL